MRALLRRENRIFRPFALSEEKNNSFIFHGVNIIITGCKMCTYITNGFLKKIFVLKIIVF